MLKKSLSLAYLTMLGCCGCEKWEGKTVVPSTGYKNIVEEDGIDSSGTVLYILPRLFNLQITPV